jgi:hypothetical protein
MADNKVSDSTDVGDVNARADAVAVEQGERDFGKGHSSIRNRAHMPNPEPRVSPLIQIYPLSAHAKGGMVKHGSATRVSCTAKSR